MHERFYRFLRVIARTLFLFLFPTKVRGIENLPAQGAAILCSNHISLLDPIALACAVNRPVRFMAKKELFTKKWFAAFLRSIGAFPVARGGTDIAALRTSLDILREGGIFGIYPQGHRERNGQRVHPFQSGAALLALRSQAAILPVHMSPYRLFRRLHIAIGPPVELSDLSSRVDSDSVREATRRITESIWRLGGEVPERRADRITD